MQPTEESNEEKGETNATWLAILFILTFLFNIFYATPLGGGEVKFLEKLEFSPGTELPIHPWDFCVTEDELFIITDYQDGNVKIYEKDNKFLGFVKIIEHFGVNDLLEPTFCFYNKDEGKFGFIDLGKRKIFIYNRVARLEFKDLKEFWCIRGGDDIHLTGDKVLISGYILDEDKKPHNLYSINIKNNQTSFLLPSYRKYALSSFKEIEDKLSPYIQVIGTEGWFDVQDNELYFVWEGNLKIIKLNVKSGELTSFGIKTSHYIQPYASEKLQEGRFLRDINITKNERAKMSYVKNIFASSKYVLVIYEGPVKPIKPDRTSNFRLQLYTLNGDFLDDVPIPGQLDERMWLDKDRNILYSLFSNPEQKEFFILKYIILE